MGRRAATIRPVLPGLRAISLGSIVFAAAASFAPFQCASEPKPELAREEEPGEALYHLAEQFKAKGASAARADTLRYLVKMYPTSRFAEAARLDLEELASPNDGSAAPKVHMGASDNASAAPAAPAKAAPSP